MSFLSTLLKRFSNASSSEVVQVYMQCGACGAPVKVRIDLLRDAVATYEEHGTLFELTKDVMDNKCFTMMRLKMTFGRGKKELSRNLDGGTFITHEENDAKYSCTTC